MDIGNTDSVVLEFESAREGVRLMVDVTDVAERYFLTMLIDGMLQELELERTYEVFKEECPEVDLGACPVVAPPLFAGCTFAEAKARISAAFADMPDTDELIRREVEKLISSLENDEEDGA